MPTPFPGMDPYLERPGLWPDVHNSLIAALRDMLAPGLRPRYYIAIEERTYLAEPEELVFIGRPDAAVVGQRVPGPETPLAEAGGGVLTVEVPIPDRVRQPIPAFPLPLRPGDEEPQVNLNGLLHGLYDRAGYDLRVDYMGEPEPPLNEPDAAWADAVGLGKPSRSA